MLKVLITDDEMQIRQGLRMKVDWEEEGFEIVGEASNGLEALEFLRSVKVEVVITDMRMPIMDGLELARQCQQEFPHIKVVVLSGYSDFDYVRGSMKEGVKDYLLKPVAPDELEETLKKIRKEAEEEKKKQAEAAQMRRLALTQLQEVQEQYLLYLVKEEWLEPAMVRERLRQLQLEELINERAEFQFITVEIRGSREDTNRLKELRLPFQMVCREMANAQDGIYSFYDPSYANMIHFIRLLGKGKETALGLANMIQNQIKRLLGLEIVIGIGNAVAGVANLKTGYISSLMAWSKSQLGSRSQVIDVSNVKEEDFEFSPDMERKLTNSVENANFGVFKQNLLTLLGSNENQSIMAFSFISNRVLFLLGAIARKYDTETKDIQKLMWSCQQSIWELNSYDKVMDQLTELALMIIEQVRTARFSNGRLIVEGVRQYLDQHYANEISLSLLSEMFHINSAHLSETFKNYAGQNFSDYLVNVRMEKAKEFLKDKQLKIIDVANLVGYSNSGYFSTVFKKHYRQTPVDYRNSLENLTS
ncbi:response regulator transcription factor [Mesobacillus foraminis]|uniref:response regulator transcription factor n=1 Tax=Mesobacillus foraminis TaxID=279826 RepID=UPI002034C007|nr:response regulator [Mesobacillus foraminis]